MEINFLNRVFQLKEENKDILGFTYDSNTKYTRTCNQLLEDRKGICFDFVNYLYNKYNKKGKCYFAWFNNELGNTHTIYITEDGYNIELTPPNIGELKEVYVIYEPDARKVFERMAKNMSTNYYKDLPEFEMCEYIPENIKETIESFINKRWDTIENLDIKDNSEMTIQENLANGLTDYQMSLLDEWAELDYERGFQQDFEEFQNGLSEDEDLIDVNPDDAWNYYCEVYDDVQARENFPDEYDDEIEESKKINKSKRIKESLEERRAYNAGYRAALREFEEDDDFTVVFTDVNGFQGKLHFLNDGEKWHGHWTDNDAAFEKPAVGRTYMGYLTQRDIKEYLYQDIDEDEYSFYIE